MKIKKQLLTILLSLSFLQSLYAYEPNENVEIDNCSNLVTSYNVLPFMLSSMCQNGTYQYMHNSLQGGGAGQYISFSPPNSCVFDMYSINGPGISSLEDCAAIVQSGLRIVNSNPSHGEIHVPYEGNITLEFSEAIDINRSGPPMPITLHEFHTDALVDVFDLFGPEYVDLNTTLTLVKRTVLLPNDEFYLKIPENLIISKMNPSLKFAGIDDNQTLRFRTNSLPYLNRIEDIQLEVNNPTYTIDLGFPQDHDRDSVEINATITDESLATLELKRFGQIGSDINGTVNFQGLSESIALNGDGTVIALGAPNHSMSSGLVQVYKNINNTWTQLGSDFTSQVMGHQLGKYVDINEDGTIVAFSVQGANHVGVYKYETNTWNQIGGFIVDAYANGALVSLSADGNTIAIGAGGMNSHVKVYKNVNNNWIQVGSEITSCPFMQDCVSSVKLSKDAKTIIIGNSTYSMGPLMGIGQSNIYRDINGTWTQIGSPINGEFPGDYSGGAVDINADGSIIAIGASSFIGTEEGARSIGKVRLFKESIGTWMPMGEVVGPGWEEYFGSSISLSDDGLTFASGSGQGRANNGYAQIYKYLDGNWQRYGEDFTSAPGSPSAPYLGSKIALNSDATIMALSAPGFNTNTGQAKIYQVSNQLLITPNEDAQGVSEVAITLDDGYDRTTNQFNLFVGENAVPSINFKLGNIQLLNNSGTTNYKFAVSDGNGDDLNVTLTSNNTDLVTVTQNWQNKLTSSQYADALDFNLTVNPDKSGLAQITITVDDDRNSSTLSFDVEITRVPVASDLDITIDEDSTFTFKPSQNREKMYLYVTTLPLKGDLTFDGKTVKLNQKIDLDFLDQLQFTPELDEFGDSYAYFGYKLGTAEINSSNEGIITYSVTPLEDAPRMTGTPNTTIYVGELYEFTPKTINPDGKSEVSFSIENKPSWAEFNSRTGKLSGTPSLSDIGTTNSIIITATGDSKLKSSLKGFTIIVSEMLRNIAPSIDTKFKGLSIKEDSGIHMIDINISDMEGDDLNLTIDSNDTSILRVDYGWKRLISQGDWDKKKLDFNVTTQDNAYGTVKITITLKDDESTVTKNFTIKVSPVNDIPILSPISDVIVFKNSDANITLVSKDIETTDLTYDYKIIRGSDKIIEDITFDENVMKINTTNNVNGQVVLKVIASDGENNVSKTFKLKVLALKKDIAGDLSSQGEVSLDNNKTIIRFDEDNITLTAPEEADENGSIFHEINFAGKRIKATSEINGSVVEITDTGVQTKFEDNITQIRAEVNATITGKATHLLEVNGTKIVARSEFVGAQTIIKKDAKGSVEVETSVDIDDNTSVKVVAREDGTAEHSVVKNGKTSKATSEILGAETLIKTSGEVETQAPTKTTKTIDGEEWVYSAVAKTAPDGTTVTTFEFRNTLTDEVSESKNTFSPTTPYEAGSEVKILEENNKVYINTITPVNSTMIVE